MEVEGDDAPPDSLWLIRSPLLAMRELPEVREAGPAGEAAA
jgi:hypothetical protein